MGPPMTFMICWRLWSFDYYPIFRLKTYCIKWNCLLSVFKLNHTWLTWQLKSSSPKNIIRVILFMGSLSREHILNSHSLVLIHFKISRVNMHIITSSVSHLCKQGHSYLIWRFYLVLHPRGFSIDIELSEWYMWLAHFWAYKADR